MNFRKVASAFPLSKVSRAVPIQVSIGIIGLMAWMAKAALMITQSVWAWVAWLVRTSSNIRDASSGVFPPERASCEAICNPSLSRIVDGFVVVGHDLEFIGQ